MNNYLSKGDNITVVTPSGGYTSGLFYKQGLIAGIAMFTSLEAAENVLVTSGVFTLPKTTAGSEAWALGDQLYWDPGTSKFTNVPGELTSYGVAAAAALAAATTGAVKLGGGGGIAAGPIAQQAAEADIAGTLTGSADGTIADVAAVSTAGGNTYADSAINTAITSINLQHKELQVKINAILAKLRLAGVIEDA